MSIIIRDIAIWTSADDAKMMGCTHYARYFGLIPGFVNDPDSGVLLWVPRSDLLWWLEDTLAFVAAFIAHWRGLEPMFGFEIGEKLP